MSTRNDIILVFNPETEDVNTLPEKVIAIMEEKYAFDFEIEDYQLDIRNSTPDQYINKTLEYVQLVRTDTDRNRLEEILSEIKSLLAEIQAGFDAWEEGEDECAMAECDPSDQFCKEMEIEALEKEMKTLLVQHA
jgi:hypothetical protein